PRYDDHFFACNTGGEQRGNVDVFSVVPSGAGFSMQTWEKAWMSGAELTDVEFGPDGRLYLSNFPSDPSGKGAIFAVLDEQARQTSLVQETHELLIQSFWEWSDHDLSDLLSHEDYRVRLRAQFALVKKGTSSLKLFQAALEQDRRFPRKLHGLWGIGQLARQGSSTSPKQALVRALRQADPLIRSQAAKLIGDLQSRAEGVALLSLLDDADLRVQAWAAIGLGKCGVHEAIGPMLDALGRNADEDAFLRHGLVYGLSQIASVEELGRLSRYGDPSVRRGAVLVLRRWESPELALFLDDLDASVSREAARAIHDLSLAGAMAALAEQLDGVDRLGSAATAADWLHLCRLLHANFRVGTKEAAERLIDFTLRREMPEGVRIFALDLLAQWDDPGPVDLVLGKPIPEGELSERSPARVESLLIAALPKISAQSEGAMLAASLRLAKKAESSLSNDVLESLLRDSARGPAVRLEALRELIQRRAPSMRSRLKGLLTDEEPLLRGEALEALFRLDEKLGIESALILLETGEVKDQQRALTCLIGRNDSRIRGEVEALLLEASQGKRREVLLEALAIAEQDSSLEEAVQVYRQSLDKGDPISSHLSALEGGDPEAGKRVYATHVVGQCNQCHRIGKSGGITGPELTTVGSRLTRHELLESLVSPSATITPGHGSTVITRRDGSTLAGVVVAESESYVTLRTGGEDDVLMVSNEVIASRQAPVSSMPPMGHLLTPREMRDLVAYLHAQVGPGGEPKRD
ncbi:MAG: HEAT repeat domain-containing protein, partial [Verrucomicrobiota bacterium]